MVGLGSRRKKIFGPKKAAQRIHVVAVLTFVIGFAAVFIAGFKVGRHYQGAEIEAADNQTAHLSPVEGKSTKP